MPKKLIKKNLNTYELMKEENSLVQQLKTSTIRKILLLAIRFHIYAYKKNGIANQY